jgi:hypothetical protein
MGPSVFNTKIKKIKRHDGDLVSLTLEELRKVHICFSWKSGGGGEGGLKI